MAATTTHDQVDSTQPLVNVNMVNVNKLTSTNYMTWSLQVHALLDGYDLTGYIDGSTPAPDQTITVDNTSSVVNPEFTKWRRQDRLIYSGLIGTLSPTIQPLVTNTKTTSHDVWKYLSSTYATPSRGHNIQQQLKKGDDDYMRGLTSRFDQLPLLGKPLEPEDKIEYVTARSKQHQQRGSNKPSWKQEEYKPSKGYQGRCQICSVFGHSARRCPTQMPQQQYTNVSPSPFRPWQPRANLAVSAQHPSTTHTGSISLPSATRNLPLNNVLCVPSIMKHKKD